MANSQASKVWPFREKGQTSCNHLFTAQFNASAQRPPILEAKTGISKLRWQFNPYPFNHKTFTWLRSMLYGEETFFSFQLQFRI